MGATKANPRYNILSLRISDEEKEALEAAARELQQCPGAVARSRIFAQVMTGGARLEGGAVTK